MAEQRVRIAIKTADHLEDLIDQGRIERPEIVYGIAADKVDSMLRLAHDQKKDSEELRAIHERVARMSMAERREVAAPIIGELVDPTE